MTSMQPNPVRRLFLSLVFVSGIAFAVTGCNDADLTIPEGCRRADLGLPPIPNASPAPTASAVPLKDSTVDPVAMRKILFEGNTSVQLSMNQLQQAKQSVEVARGNLLPSLNLGMLLQFGTGGGFVLSAVQILLPFLVPSRWFDFFQVKELLEADKVALQLVKVNTYASAYSLYVMIRADTDVKGILEREATDLGDIEAYVSKAYAVGMASKTDLDLAKGRAAQARVNFSKITALVLATERPSFRHALGLNLDDEFKLTAGEVPVSPWEGQTPMGVLESALELSLESRQIGFLEKAAGNATWSKVFGFINSSSLSGTGRTTAFSGQGMSENIGIGFGYFPAIQLSQLNEESMKIRQREIRLEISETLEKVLTNLGEARRWVQAAGEAEVAYRDAYVAKLQQYKLGLADLLQVLQTRTAFSEASVEVLRSKAQLDLDRVTLHRAMLSDQFAEIPGCSFVTPSPLPSSSP